MERLGEWRRNRTTKKVCTNRGKEYRNTKNLALWYAVPCDDTERIHKPQEGFYAQAVIKKEAGDVQR